MAAHAPCSPSTTCGIRFAAELQLQGPKDWGILLSAGEMWVELPWLIGFSQCLAQGVFPPKTFAMYGLPGHWYGALEWQYPPHQRQGSYEEEGRAVNTMKVWV